MPTLMQRMGSDPFSTSPLVLPLMQSLTLKVTLMQTQMSSVKKSIKIATNLNKATTISNAMSSSRHIIPMRINRNR